MNIINFKHREDYGTEWYVQILNVRNWSALQVSVSWNEYPSWPYYTNQIGEWNYAFYLILGI
jgi:hypothetical protein